jgi:hypothetical protein
VINPSTEQHLRQSLRIVMDPIDNGSDWIGLDTQQTDGYVAAAYRAIEVLRAVRAEVQAL